MYNRTKANNADLAKGRGMRRKSQNCEQIDDRKKGSEREKGDQNSVLVIVNCPPQMRDASLPSWPQRRRLRQRVDFVEVL